ncbi:MAG: hypothetical protein KatS3mg105_1948 [Gemmatales bacterium]|nr:MAG: hypothetical protein KatS3mg105_1948 [Gemmatales bacterium]
MIGCRLGDDSLGAISELTSELRAKLTEPGTIVIDESELGRLGLTNGIDETVEIGGQRVRIVGLVRGLKGIAAPYVFCSVRTARPLLRMAENQTTFLLARCDNPKLADAAARRLKAYSDMSAYTAREFSLRSRMHWLTKTKAGIALGYTALLGLLVGGVVTSQTLYAATAASLREYAVLRALGIPRWRMSAMVLAQSFWVGLAGNLLAVGPAFFFAWVADVVGVKVMLPGWLLAASLGITMFMAMISGLAALRSLRLSEPAILLR